MDFSWEAFIDQDFTSDIRKLEQGWGTSRRAAGRRCTTRWWRVRTTCRKNAKQPKQVLLVVTDGEDNASSATLEQAIRKIQELDGPVIYSIGLLFGADTDKREARHAQRVLQTLSEQTGGIAYFPKSLKDVDAITARWRRTSGSSTPSATSPRSRRGWAGTGRCTWMPRKRATAG